MGAESIGSHDADTVVEVDKYHDASSEVIGLDYNEENTCHLCVEDFGKPGQAVLVREIVRWNPQYSQVAHSVVVKSKHSGEGAPSGSFLILDQVSKAAAGSGDGRGRCR